MPPKRRDVEASACWNASKMIFCFSGAMPIPVSVIGQRNHVPGAAQHAMVGAPAVGGHLHVHRDASLGGELDGVGKQVLENLLQVAWDRW